MRTADEPASERTDLGAAVDGWRERAGDLPEASTDSGLDVAPLYTPLDAPEETYAERLGVPGDHLDRAIEIAQTIARQARGRPGSRSRWISRPRWG